MRNKRLRRVKRRKSGELAALVQSLSHLRQSEIARQLNVTRGAVNHVFHAHKTRARHQFQNAVRTKLIERPSACSKCGKPCVPDGHHPDYSKPLDVLWLCRQCHGDVHKSERIIVERIPIEKPPKTHCIRGHEYTQENTGSGRNGNRFCKECHRINSRNYQRRKTNWAERQHLKRFHKALVLAESWPVGTQVE